MFWIKKMAIDNANILLLSSSRVGETPYLEHAIALIKQKLNGVTELLFIPYAGVTLNYDKYTTKVQDAFAGTDITVKGLHQFDNASDAINNAQAIVVGGGNTFHLLHQLYQQQLIKPIQNSVSKGVPYIGWSAGSNIAGRSIRTTNDMPIIEPKSFDALQLVDFQLNPHYTDYTPPGHNGETRAQRLAEFMVLNPATPIVAIVEGTALDIKQNTMVLTTGVDTEINGYIFKSGDKQVISTHDNLNFLLT